MGTDSRLQVAALFCLGAGEDSSSRAMMEIIIHYINQSKKRLRLQTYFIALLTQVYLHGSSLQQGFSIRRRFHTRSPRAKENQLKKKIFLFASISDHLSSSFFCFFFFLSHSNMISASSSLWMYAIGGENVPRTRRLPLLLPPPFFFLFLQPPAAASSSIEEERKTHLPPPLSILNPFLPPTKRLLAVITPAFRAARPQKRRSPAVAHTLAGYLDTGFEKDGLMERRERWMARRDWVQWGVAGRGGGVELDLAAKEVEGVTCVKEACSLVLVARSCRDWRLE